MSLPAIHIENLSMRYKGNQTDSLSEVSFDVAQKSFFGIIGPNGAGKTTLISILCGILTPSSGNYWYHIDGKAVSGKEVKPYIGYVPQDFAFYEEMSPFQNLMFFGAMYNLDRQTIAERAEKLLKTLGLWDVRNKKTGRFSGGMKRRVNLAIGILHRPAILFLDEPIVGVDVQSKRAILRLLKEENEKGTTLVYTSHHMKDAEELCTHILLLDHGRLIDRGTTAQLIERSGARNLEEYFVQMTGENYRD